MIASCSSSKNTSPSRRVNWLSFAQVQDSLRHTPKKVLVDVYASWCIPCKKMDKVTYKNSEVVDYINKNFYAIKFDAESMDSIAYQSKLYTNSMNQNQTHNLTYEIAKDESGIAFPTTTVLNEKLNKITITKGLLFPSDMLELLRKINE